MWVVDSSQLDDAAMMRLLCKLGTTIDVAGMSESEAADTLRALAPDGIVAYADSQMASASALAGRLGLDYHDAEVAERLLDKSVQRRALAAGGLPVPRCVELPAESSAADLLALVADVDFPVVLKPRHGAAGRDTVLVGDASQLVRLITQPAAAGAQLADGALMVIEEYMVGASPPPSTHFADYLSIESVVVDGTISHIAATGRTPQAEPFRETGLVIPCDFGHCVVDEALDVATKAIFRARGSHRLPAHRDQGDHERFARDRGQRPGGRLRRGDARARRPGVDLFEISQRVALGEQRRVRRGRAPRIASVTRLWNSRRNGRSGSRASRASIGWPSFPASRRCSSAGDPVTTSTGARGSHEYVFSVLGWAPDYEGVHAVQKFMAKEVIVNYS